MGTAERPLPRKVPIRVEPKSFFANERTFLSWVQMAVTLAGVSSALLSLQSIDADSENNAVISTRTIDVITMTMIPLAVCILFYALYIYHIRGTFMEKRQVGSYSEKIGPIVIGAVMATWLTAVFIFGLLDIFF